jgi:2-keto-4-pentenoate hydratase/2-oxohepta-3-ene-1,7-dioic acid hydratase in catechol pathway
MRFATVTGASGPRVAVLVGDRAIPLNPRLTMRDVVAGAGRAPRRSAQSLPLAAVALGPAVPDPGAIYTVGDNYRTPDGRVAGRGARPLIYGKAPSSVGGSDVMLSWDRSLTDNVDAECELGVVIGRSAQDVSEADAMSFVFGYTIMNDISSRDPWLDGDQWLLGKSLPGFCPVGPWIVTSDELDPSDLRLGCTINGEPIQDGRTSDMWFSIPEIVSFLSRHVALRPGDLIASGTPARLRTPPGPGRRLEPGDTVSAWIEGIGELTTNIA